MPCLELCGRCPFLKDEAWVVESSFENREMSLQNIWTLGDFCNETGNLKEIWISPATFFIKEKSKCYGYYEAEFWTVFGCLDVIVDNIELNRLHFHQLDFDFKSDKIKKIKIGKFKNGRTYYFSDREIRLILDRCTKGIRLHKDKDGISCPYYLEHMVLH